MQLLHTLGIDSKTSPATAMLLAANYIEEGTDTNDRLDRANNVITDLGGPEPEDDADFGRIVAKYMVGKSLSGEQGQAAARELASKLVTAQPYLRREAIVNGPSTLKPIYRYVPKTDRRKGERNDKAKFARDFVKNTTMTDRGDVCRAIQKELTISYALTSTWRNSKRNSTRSSSQ
jgi:hypothetical protein